MTPFMDIDVYFFTNPPVQTSITYPSLFVASCVSYRVLTFFAFIPSLFGFSGQGGLNAAKAS